MLPDYYTDKGFQRKVKSRLKAREQHYVIKVPPPFSAICAAEITAFGFTGLEQTDSGIELKGALADVYTLNLKLQTASRIFLEIKSFKAGAREELYRKSFKIPWELYLNPLLPLVLKAHVRKSLIKHEGMTIQTLFEAICDRFAGQGISPPALLIAADQPAEHQRLEIIVIKNKARIRMDTTGNHLHKRGYREIHGKAPIRETLAAGFLKWVFHGRETLPSIILDPMCGSGTLLLETWIHFSGYYPGLKRDFLFTRLPWHRAKTFRYMKRTVESPDSQKVPRLLGRDISPRAIAIAKDNARIIDPGKDIFLEPADFFHRPAGEVNLEIDEKKISDNDRWIISNPPYGVRLEEGTQQFLKTMIHRFQSTYSGWNIALILPSYFNIKRLLPKGTRSIEKTLSFSNGGIPVTGVVFRP
ncbi:MAG: hypothetical protein QGH40_02030 [bacterium]|nr:hypothetical protein [bacterium]